MAIQELLIKNMVCERCVWAVQTALEGLGYTVQGVELGRATVEANSLDLAAVAQGLEVIGLELLTDRNTRIASQIKVLIIDLIRSGNLAGMKMALSDYLASKVGLEYSYLTHLFSTTQNLTIEQFWVLQRVERAKERLVIKETGQPIIKGQVLYEVYSEQLLVDQQEYLVALQQQQELGPSEKRYGQFRQAAEQKLRLYGLTPDQITRLARTRTVQSRIPFVAPVGGTVTEIAVSEGQYVGEGALLYRLVNLNQLWVEADLYAGESNYVKVGDRLPVEIVGNEETRNLTARVTFINPEYRAGSQVLTMRAVLSNPTGRLQPGQPFRFVSW